MGMSGLWIILSNLRILNWFIVKKHIYATTRFICKVSQGYQSILENIECKKRLFQQNAESIVSAIDKTVSEYPLKVVEACKFYGVSKGWYYRQKSQINCKLSKINRCFRQHPNQLSIQEVSGIERVVNDPLNFGKRLITLYHQVLRDGKLFCCVSTFRKYGHLSGYRKRKKNS